MNKFRSIIALAGVAVAAVSCVVDEDFRLNGLSDVDPEMTIFGGNGMVVPIGSTEKLYIGEAIKNSNDSTLRSVFRADANGNYSLNLSGKYDLHNITDSLDLSAVTNLDGVALSENIDYELKFNTGLDSLGIPSMSAEKSISTEFYKYLPDTDLGSQIANQDQEYELIDISELNKYTGGLPGTGNEEVNVQQWLEYEHHNSVKLDTTREVAGSLDLGENAGKIAGLSNFILKNGSKVTVDLSFENCPLTKGTVTPELTVNLSKMMTVQGADADGDVSLSSLILNEDNGWKASKVLTVTSLADDFLKLENGKISFSGDMVLNGSVEITGAKSTKNTISALVGKKAVIKAVVKYEDFVLKSVDITLGSNVKFSTEDISIPVDFSADLPEAVQSVDSIILDVTKPMTLELSASNLSGIKTTDGNKHLSLDSDIEIQFPTGIAIAGCPDGKIKIKGDLYDGKIDTNITIRGIKPSNASGKVSFQGGVSAKVSAVASGTFSSCNLPKDEKSDVVVKAEIKYTPEVKDVKVTLNKDKVSQAIDYDCMDIIFLSQQTLADMPKELKALRNLEFDGVNASAEIVLNGLPEGLAFSLKNTAVTLPAFVYAADGSNKVAFDSNMKIQNGVAVNTSAALGGLRNVQLSGITELKGDIKLTASLVCESSNVDLSDLPEKLTGTVKIAVGNGTTVSNPGKIAISKLVVNAAYSLDKSNMAKVGDDVPKSLQEDDINFGINPILDVTLRTNLGIPLTGAFEFIPYFKGKADDNARVEIKGIAMPCSTDASDTLSKRYIIGVGVEQTQPDATYIPSDLSKIVRRIPDSLEMKVKADISELDSCVFYPSAKYACGIDYTMTIPLCFSDSMNFCYVETVAVDSVVRTLSEVSSVRVVADIINTLPIGVSVELIPLDENGTGIKGLDNAFLEIRPGDGKTETIQHAQLDIDYKGKDLSAVKKMMIRFSINTTPKVYVREDQYIQILNLSVVLPDGVTIPSGMLKQEKDK